MSYLVIGETGFREERKVWVVASWRHEISANTHAELANRWCILKGLHAPLRPHWRPLTEPPVNPWDPNMEYDFLTGVEYRVDEVVDLMAQDFFTAEREATTE